MRSRSASFILLVGAVGLLAACGSGPSEPNPEDDMMMPAAASAVDSTTGSLLRK